MLQVQLLGDFTLTFDGTPVTAVNTARLQSLLAYLVLHRDAPQPRRHLAFLFWPDSSEAQAFTNLRKLVYQLRQALPQAEGFLHADAKTVQWNPAAPLTLDVAEFQSAVERRWWQEAIACYRGDFLPGCYDEWIAPERERLQQMLFGALEKLSLQLEAAHHYADAIGYAEQLVQRDPLREESYRHLIRLHMLNDDRAAALHAYHTCVTVLRRELDIDPSPFTREMHERLLNLQTQPPLPTRLPAAMFPLVGRESEWATLQQAWREAAARPRLVLIKGEAGIGKTRLAEELIEWTSRQGFAALTAHCYPAQGQLAYAPIAEWLRAHSTGWHGLEDIWLTELARLLPEILAGRPDLPQPAPLTEDWQRVRLFKALAYALLKGHPSLLLHLDDVQWCDRDSLDWLRYLLQSHVEPSVHAQVLVIGTSRIEEVELSHPLHSLVAALRRADQVIEVELGPLGEAATLALAGYVAGQPLDRTLAPLFYQGTEGHPLFVVEMLRAGPPRLGQRTSNHAHAMIQRPEELPLKVRRVIEARLAQLSPTAQDLAGVAAVIGRAFTFEVVRHASSSDEETLVRGLDELWQRRIIREQGAAAYDFSHDKIREVAYSNLSSARRRLLHRKVAEALEAVQALSVDAVSGQIARHYEVAGQLERAIEYYRRAADAAQRTYANAEAMELYQQALGLVGQAGDRAHAAPLYEGQGGTLERIGQHEAARQAYQSALPLTGETVSGARLRRKIGNTYRHQGQYDLARQWYDESKAALQSVSLEQRPWQEWIELHLDLMRLYYNAGDSEPLAKLACEFRPVVEQHGTPSQQGHFSHNVVRANYRRDRYAIRDETLAASRAALAVLHTSGQIHEIAVAQFGVSFTLLWQGNLTEAVDGMLTALRLFEQTGDPANRLMCLTYLTVAHRRLGNAEQVRQYATCSLSLATSRQVHSYIGVAEANLAWLEWRAGELDMATTRCQAALAHMGVAYPFQWTALLVLLAALLARQQIEPAIGYARALMDPAQQLLPDPIEPLLKQAICAWEEGQPEAAKLHFEQAIAHAQTAQYL